MKHRMGGGRRPAMLETILAVAADAERRGRSCLKTRLKRCERSLPKRYPGRKLDTPCGILLRCEGQRRP